MEETVKKPRKKSIKRAYSPSELMRMKRPEMAFTGKWKEAFGCPAPTGLWCIWGNSANGKSSFVMQLAKYLCRFGKVFYNSVEEGKEPSFINNIERNNMQEVDGRFRTDTLSMEELDERMSDPRKEDIYIIDSFQAAGYTVKGATGFRPLVKRHPDKLIIFISRADGSRPQGRPADTCVYDAGMKIYVEAFRAKCIGRFNPEGASFIIWEEGVAKYGESKTATL